MTLCQRNDHRRTKSHVQLDRENPKSTEEMIIKVIIIIFSVQHKLYHMLTGIAKVKIDLVHQNDTFMTSEAEVPTIGPLHNPVTWYKIKYTGEQVAQWDL